MRKLIKKILLEYSEKGTMVYRGLRGDGLINATYNGSDDGMGTFWTDNLTMAKQFAGLIKYDVNTNRYEIIENSNGKIIKKQIRFESPYIIKSNDENNDSFQKYMENIEKFGGVESYKENLLSNGYDGIILKNNNTNYYEYGTYDIYIDLLS